MCQFIRILMTRLKVSFMLGNLSQCRGKKREKSDKKGKFKRKKNREKSGLFHLYDDLQFCALLY